MNNNKRRTAEEWQQILSQHLTDRKQFLERQADAEKYEDLRDDVISLVNNSGLGYDEIHARCGPHPRTLSAWANKEVSRPQMGKMLSTLRILGRDIGII